MNRFYNSILVLCLMYVITFFLALFFPNNEYLKSSLLLDFQEDSGMWFFQEPLNSVSNLIYLLPLGLSESDIPFIILCAGSFVYHSIGSNMSLLLDKSGMGLVVITICNTVYNTNISLFGYGLTCCIFGFFRIFFNSPFFNEIYKTFTNWENYLYPFASNLIADLFDKSDSLFLKIILAILFRIIFGYFNVIQFLYTLNFKNIKTRPLQLLFLFLDVYNLMNSSTDKQLYDIDYYVSMGLLGIALYIRQKFYIIDLHSIWHILTGIVFFYFLKKHKHKQFGTLKKRTKYNLFLLNFIFILLIQNCKKSCCH